MRKLNLQRLIILLILASIPPLLLLLVNTYKDTQGEKAPAPKEITRLPASLPFLPLDPFDYPAKNQKTILFYFNPECDHCDHEAADIQTKLEEFQSTQMIWVASVDSTTIREFAQKHQLDQELNIHWMSDTAYQFPKLFNPDLLPSSWVFDQDGKLLKHFNGQVKVEALLKYL